MESTGIIHIAKPVFGIFPSFLSHVRVLNYTNYASSNTFPARLLGICFGFKNKSNMNFKQNRLFLYLSHCFLLQKCVVIVFAVGSYSNWSTCIFLAQNTVHSQATDFALKTVQYVEQIDITITRIILLEVNRRNDIRLTSISLQI